ncbi:MAG: YraN family protein [Gammaproteobacteria bacterium]|nr:MAG: YraN family protein [Gammaproteobacteria bacterium]
MKTSQQGKIAEDEACHFLKKQGLKLVEKNYRCRTGEIDLIMQDKETLVFVEVRYRTKNDYGSALDSVDQRKIEKLISAAGHYVSTHQPDLPMRFDVVGFDASLKPNWVSNAFPAF